MNDRRAFQKVAFLDTNTLHYIGIYLEYSKDRDLFPWDFEDATKEKETAIGIVNNIEEAGLRKSLRKGLETVDLLLTQGIQVQYAPVSELELLTGRTKGRAILSAAEEGVPDRIWSRFQEKEIRERVGPTELMEIKDKVDRLTSMLEEARVAVKANHSGQTSDALELAKDINGLVYMEAMDSVIYANALVAQAKYLFTADGYLKETVNYIHNPCGKPRYEEIRRQLQKLICQIILGNPDDVELPSAHTVTANGTLSPDLRVPGANSSS